MRIGDQLADPVGGDQDLDRRDHALAVGAWQEPLRHDPAQGAGQGQPGLRLLVRREQRGEPAHRLGRVRRGQRRQHEAVRLGRRQRELRRLAVAELAHEDHVGILTQRRAERRENDIVSCPSSRWFRTDRLSANACSIGDSTVRMWQARCALM